MLAELPVRPVRPHQYGGQLASLDSRSHVRRSARCRAATRRPRAVTDRICAPSCPRSPSRPRAR